MKPVTVSTSIARPREEVFDFLAPLANHEAFTDHVLTDWEIVGEGRQVRVTVNAPGQKVRAEITALSEERPHTTVERTTSAGGKRSSIGTYRLTEAPGGGTHVEFEVAFENLLFVDRLGGPLTRVWLRKQNARSMARLKALLESSVAHATTPATVPST